MGKLAFVFAGQGAQKAGMGRDLYDRFDSVRQLFDLSAPIRELCFNGPQEALDSTLNAQPALFLTDLACAAALGENGIVADGVTGFSLGEIPACCYAGLMNPVQAYDFVRERAKAMQACAQRHPGGMLAVLKLPEGQVEHICSQLPQAYPVNYNCPGQTVVACAQGTVEELQKRVAQAGGKAIGLAVSGAFHSPFMDTASQTMAEYLEKTQLDQPRIPLYANATAQPYHDPKALLAQQINHPVLWQKTIENMIADGFDRFVEVGPGKTLSGLIKKINASIHIYHVSDLPSLDNTQKELKHA